KLQRFVTLIKKYPATKFSCLIDNLTAAKNIANAAIENNMEVPIYIDLNVGMNRTGIIPGDSVVELYKACTNTKGILPLGLHAYDGHRRAMDIQQRTIECDKAFEGVLAIQKELIEKRF